MFRLQNQVYQLKKGFTGKKPCFSADKPVFKKKRKQKQINKKENKNKKEEKTKTKQKKDIQRTTLTFVEIQPMHQNRNFLLIFCRHFS